MNSLEDFRLFLPKYLSPDSQKNLFSELKYFPHNIDKRLYSLPPDENLILQGDGLHDMLVINLPDTRVQKGPALVLSNTCDIDPSNERFFDTSICYSPIFNLEKYTSAIEKRNFSREKAKNHIESVNYHRPCRWLPERTTTPDNVIRRRPQEIEIAKK